MAKKKTPIEISFINEPAAEIVTGSMVHVKTENYNILLDAGFYQSADIAEDYRINNRTLKSLKMKDIDYVILSHNHGDHIFYAPLLFKRNCKAQVIVPEQSSAIMRAMLDDCAHINEKDAAYLSIREGREYLPLYTKDDVSHFMNYVREYPTHTKIELNNEITIQFIPSGHLLKGCQVILYIKDKEQTKKILYTGDLGNKHLKQPFTESFEAVKKANIVIAESTYGASKDLQVTKKERELDLQKIKYLVEEQVIRNKGRLLIPVFAQARAETVLYLLHEIYGNDSEFKTNIYIDSPLACKIFKIYPSLLDDQDAEHFNKMVNWNNVHFITEAQDSIELVASDEPCIILSSSGMCTNGRVKYHLKSLVGNSNATILFTGYSTEGSLAYHLKQGDKSVTMNGEEYSVKCNIKSLQSLSSHIPYSVMLEYYSNIQCNKLILHHGNIEGKKQLKKDLDEFFEEKCLTTKVIVSDKNTMIEI